MSNRKNLRLLAPESSLVTSKMNAAPADNSAEKCRTDLVESDPRLRRTLVPPSTKGDDPDRLNLSGQTVVTRCG